MTSAFFSSQCYMCGISSRDHAAATPDSGGLQRGLGSYMGNLSPNNTMYGEN